MTHADLIDQLGGSRVVADEFGLDQSTVSCWKTREVSWRFRPKVAALAKRKRVTLPEGFLA